MDYELQCFPGNWRGFVGSCIVSNWVRGARWVYSWVYYGGSGVAYGVGLGTWRTGAYFVGVQTDDVV